MSYGQSTTTPSTSGLESEFSRMSFDHDFPDAPRVVSFEKENGSNADDETSSSTEFLTHSQKPQRHTSSTSTPSSLAETFGPSHYSSRGRQYLKSPEPVVRISQAHHRSSPTSAAAVAEPYLVTPDNHHLHHVLFADADDDAKDENYDDAIDDSLDVPMIMDDHHPHRELTSNCLLPEVERSDCPNPVALTLWHNNNNNNGSSVSGGSSMIIREDWHYLNRVDVAAANCCEDAAAGPAPIARRPPLPNLISRPQPIRPQPSTTATTAITTAAASSSSTTTTTATAQQQPPPPWMFCCTTASSEHPQSH